MLLLTAWESWDLEIWLHCLTEWTIGDLLSICPSDNFVDNVHWSHLLAIDHRSSLVINIQYHSQTVFVMNQYWGLQLLWYHIPTVVQDIKSICSMIRLWLTSTSLCCLIKCYQTSTNKIRCNIHPALIQGLIDIWWIEKYGTHNLAKHMTISNYCLML